MPVLIIIWTAILGGILLVASALDAIGFLCIQSKHKLVGGLVFGLPAAFMSLLIFVFCTEVMLVWLIPFAALPLFLGLLVIFRGVQTGQKQGDIIYGVVICVCFIALGLVLGHYPHFLGKLFGHILPTMRG